MKVFLKEGKTQKISFNGPVRTGLFLQSKNFLINGYKEFQRDFVNTLSATAPGIWGASNLAYYSNSDECQADTLRGEPIIPSYFVTRILKDNYLLDILDKHNLQSTIEAPPFKREFSPAEENREIGPSPATFLISSIEIRMNDFGYGCVIFSGAIKANRDLDIVEFKELGANLAPLLNTYYDIFRNTFETVWKSIPKDVLLNTSFIAGKNSRDSRKYYMGLNRPIGHMIYVMRILEIACSSDEEFIEAKKEYIPALFSQDEKYVCDSSLDENMSIYTGYGNYVVIYQEQKVSHWQRSLLSRVMRVIDVFYVMFEEVTENLIYLNNSINLDDAAPNPKELEDKARMLVEYRAKSEFFRAIYDDYDNHTDPQSLKIWRDVEENWDTEDRLYALKNQLDLSGHIHDRLMSDLGSIHNRKVNAFILIFTVLGMIAFILNLIDFTQNSDEFTAPDNLRLMILGLMAFIIFGFTLRIVKNSEKH